MTAIKKATPSNTSTGNIPDIVLFINGIPLGIIECKRPDLKEAIEQAVSQHLRHHSHTRRILERMARTIHQRRYQQYFAVNQTMERITRFDGDTREGGVIWHTQGSGKSLTMVMLAQSIVLSKEIRNPRIILVTDRTDLDR